MYIPQRHSENSIITNKLNSFLRIIHYRYMPYKTYKIDAARIEIPVIPSNCLPENTLALKLIFFVQEFQN